MWPQELRPIMKGMFGSPAAAVSGFSGFLWLHATETPQSPNATTFSRISVSVPNLRMSEFVAQFQNLCPPSLQEVQTRTAMSNSVVVLWKLVELNPGSKSASGSTRKLAYSANTFLPDQSSSELDLVDDTSVHLYQLLHGLDLPLLFLQLLI
ncbi:hypothetical protein EYF80_003306 [Liparis tanakae]|uniref:Uncharacterized protein n=1 Tax=Liparis tanakae TaxID=230148 RepID=A0A4Z2J8K0_9TELE|nr:hypothetical protein EYF80_003306 [Liparis tanakae]